MVMPRAWVQSGSSYQLKTYIDDDVPLKVRDAERRLRVLLEQLHAEGIILAVPHPTQRLMTTDVVFKEIPKQKIDEKRLQALDDLTEQAQELDMGY